MKRQVIVELQVPLSASAHWVQERAGQLGGYFHPDPDYMLEASPDDGERTRSRHRAVLLRGWVDEGREKDLEASPDVIRVWSDAPIQALETVSQDGEEVDESSNKGFMFGF